MNELKPCPFCGGEAEVVESDYGMYLTGYAVYCRKCCLKMGVTGRLGEAYEWTPVFNTEAEAIDAWNKRAERTCMMVLETRRLSDGNDFEWHSVVCSECGAEFHASQLSILTLKGGRVVFSMADCDGVRQIEESDYSGPYHGSDYRYCPRCGAKVIGGDA